MFFRDLKDLKIYGEIKRCILDRTDLFPEALLNVLSNVMLKDLFEIYKFICNLIRIYLILI